MQRLSRKAEAAQRHGVARMRPSVHRITQQWMPLVRHVDPHLMGATGFESAFDQTRSQKRLNSAEMRHCALATTFLDDRDFLAITGGSGERCVDGSGSRRGVARDNGLIDALDTVIEKLARQTLMCRIGFGDDDEA